MKKQILKIFIISLLAIIALCTVALVSIALDWSSKETLTKSLSYWLNKPSIDEHRNHIFCNTLKPGMDREAVLETLQQFGEFTYSESSWQSSKDTKYSEIAGKYLDEQVAGRNTLILSFQDGKYLGASMIVLLDDTESVCQ